MTLTLLIVLYFTSANGFLNIGMESYPKKTSYNDGSDPGDPGDPLFLTPYIESGKIEEGRNLSRVNFPGFPRVKSYSGFMTVDKRYNSNQFFWYFPAVNNQRDSRTDSLGAALYIWLQGGPGASSLYGLFEENGVFKVENNTFKQRDIYWSFNDHILYIDNPVETGFSFTNESRGYCTNQTQIAEHLYNTLLQFLQLFPELQTLDFFISGESYAGKYVPALGYYIHMKNPTAKIKVNLKGMLIGNGWSDPINQLDYGAYLYETGLIDWEQKNKAEELQNKTKKLIENEKWKEAKRAINELHGFLDLSTGPVSFYNYMYLGQVLSDSNYSHLIQTTEIRKAIHVGNLRFDEDTVVAKFLEDDFMQSVAPWISELLEHYHILFYNGQYDIICAYPLTTNFLRKLKFSGSDDYLNAKRVPVTYSYKGTDFLIGYMKNAEKKNGTEMVFGNLMDMLVRGAGHMVPKDQPNSIALLIWLWRQRIN